MISFDQFILNNMLIDTKSREIPKFTITRETQIIQTYKGNQKLVANKARFTQKQRTQK